MEIYIYILNAILLLSVGGQLAMSKLDDWSGFAVFALYLPICGRVLGWW